MPKNITIDEGDKARGFGPVKRLVTTTGSGTCSWVPEDDVRTTVKHISENGVFLPSQDEVYGYSKVTVNVRNGGPGSSYVVGKKMDGNDYAFSVDDEGNIQSELVPSYIVVTKAPNKLEYLSGETIDYGGIEVTAYTGDGEPFDSAAYTSGAIPYNELVFPVTTADYSSSESGDGRVDTDTLTTSGQVKFEYDHELGHSGHIYTYDATAEHPVIVQYSIKPNEDGTHHPIGWEKFGAEVHSYSNGAYSRRWSIGVTGKPGTCKLTVGPNVKVYYYDNFDKSTWDDPNTDPTMPGAATTGKQELPVQWPTPWGNTLETSFYITVEPSVAGGAVDVAGGIS